MSTHQPHDLALLALDVIKVANVAGLLYVAALLRRLTAHEAHAQQSTTTNGTGIPGVQP
jgi:hypothetical protein